MVIDMGVVPGAGIVEGRATFEPKRHAAVDDSHSTYKLVGGRRDVAADGHVVGKLADAVGVQESRDENIGVWPVVLLLSDIVASCGDAEPTALPIIENRGEDAGSIEVRNAHPINRAVHADQRGGVHIAYQAVVLDGLIRHGVALTCGTLSSRLNLANLVPYPRKSAEMHRAKVRQS
jgi:hypothetical protein